MDRKPEDQEVAIVPASSNVPVVQEGRVQLHRAIVPLYEVSEEQLDMLEMTGQDAGIEFNAFVASTSAGIATALTITTTQIPDQTVSLWWHGACVAFIGLAIVFFVLWVRKKGQFKKIVVKIKSQKLL